MGPKKEQYPGGQEDDEAPQYLQAGSNNDYIRLLESGDYADVRLECGDRLFDCHRPILSSNSGWFRDKFIELNQKALPLRAEPALTMDRIRTEVDPRATDKFGQPTESLIKASIRLFNLGHDFRVKNLAEFASARIGESLSLALKMICDQRLTNQQHPNGRTELQDRLRKTGFMRTFLEGLEAADWVRSQGDEEMERIRPWQMLIDFFIAGKEVLLAEPEMDLFLDADLVPSFAKSVLQTERRNGHSHSRWMRTLVAKPPEDMSKRQGPCWVCGIRVNNIKKTGGIALVNPKSMLEPKSKQTDLQFCCVQCAEKESNIGEDGLVKWEVFNAKKP
ncbi:hypothetical protein N0V93_008657 [Gnomoniopsis smithogilvyi]|uniref:BTB domain-containing protein n=1 Tax=Gnomoniopsis smithogilvyi TaxID=1191159 RepID=A0A9W9CUZ7_9PEZI|nr:hypothetical protein N0V93_008657 [Gnomoniopsis smithogilvyi]